MIADLFRKFDDHPILYSALIGVFLDVFVAPAHDVANSIMSSALTAALIGSLSWYALKAIFVTGTTIKNWEKTNPGEPWFKSGGSTEYDEERCRQTGKAVADAIRRQSHES